MRKKIPVKKLKAKRHRKRGKIVENREAVLTIRAKAALSRQRPIEVKI